MPSKKNFGFSNKRTFYVIPMAIIVFVLAFQFAFSGMTTSVSAAKKDYILKTPNYGKVRDTMSDTWVAIDDLDRWVATGDTVRDVQEEKQVLMFYYTWHLPQHVTNIYNIADILESAAETGRHRWGTVNAFHYWDEPYFGYYRSDDPWVIRKDIQMLCDAGVDGVYFDAGNGYLYHDAYKAFFKENMDRKAEGQSYLKATWMIRAKGPHTSVSSVLGELYETYYKSGEYDDVLYTINDKPLMLCKADVPIAEYKNFFETRDCWAWANGEGKWPWLEYSPQEGGWALGNTSKEREMVSVSAAQHPTTGIGKSYSKGVEPPVSEQDPGAGIYFKEQWDRALELDPQFVLVTQWNEWMAQRFVASDKTKFINKVISKGETFFVDVYSAEYSRDIAPMKGGYGDNYYYMLTSYIRQFKGAREIPAYKEQMTVNMEDFASAGKAQAVFYDDLYDTLHRDHPSSSNSKRYHYSDDSGRNDFEEAHVTSDANNLYFYVRTVDNITAPEGTNWMNLLLNTDADYSTGWHGYDYVVNRTINGKVTSIESFGADGKYEFNSVGEAAINYSGKEMIISVPKNIVNVSGDKFTVDFKFTDNVPEQDDIMLFIDKGDVAPNNRFNYRYNYDINAKAITGTTVNVLPIIIGVAAVILVVLIILVIVFVKGSKSKKQTAGDNSANAAEEAEATVAVSEDATQTQTVSEEDNKE